MAVKYVFVTGGVVSGLGKGITAASLGRLLKARGYKVTMQKFDPYINVDPGTMNPIQHGEVFVTDDGTETDLDLGHYERFIDESLDKNSNVTTGKVYWSVLQKERHGDFGGGTVQVIPHITNEIKSRFYRGKEVDEERIAIIEVGGTVGDIESQPFLEAIRQFQHDVGHETPTRASVRAADKTAAFLYDRGVRHLRLIINQVTGKRAADEKLRLISIIDGAAVKLIGAVPYDSELIRAGDEGKLTDELYSKNVTRAFDNIAARTEGEQIPLFYKIRRLKTLR